VRTAAVVILLLAAACEANTEDLSGQNRDAFTPDTPLADVPLPDVPSTTPDSGLECTRAADCPNTNGSPLCEGDPSNCKCGCYLTCSANRCTSSCHDSPECQPSADGGVPPEVECQQASDCPDGQLPRVCFDQGAASCAFSACVLECEGARTCTTQGDCIACTTATSTAPNIGCPTCLSVPLGEAGIEESSCELGLGMNDLITFNVETDCSYKVDFAGQGGPTDRLVALDNGQLVGYLEKFDTPCLVTFAATGALRTVWSCPGCAFTLFHR
jgi:hypothetical protein